MPDHELSEKERLQLQLSGQSEQVSQQSALERAEEKVQNPDFLDSLRDPKADSEKYDWIQDELGPLFAGAHLIANRSEEYEQEITWLNRNRAERMRVEATPGRLVESTMCRAPGGGRMRPLAAIAHGTNRREDAESPDPITPEETRVLRDAVEAATNYQSLAIGNTGLKAVSEATTVHKSEETQTEEGGIRSRMKRLYNG